MINRNNFEALFNSKVASVEVNDDETVTVGYVDGHHLKPKGKLTFDRVVMTSPPRPTSLVRFTPRIEPEKQRALASFHVMNSVKVFLVFNNPFWATPNKAAPIPFNSSTSINGGSGVSDLSTSYTFYPSHPFHGPVILASYTWEDAADALTALSDEAIIEQMLSGLVEVHGEVARESFSEGLVKKWLLDANAGGAFPWADPFQVEGMQEALRSDHLGRVFFAGEYTAKEDHGWMQAAVESACRVAHHMIGR